MSVTLVVWLLMFVAFTVLALQRPVWGVAVYMLSFFASPPYWWWGDMVAGYRWSLYGGVILLISVLVTGSFTLKFSSDWLTGLISLAGVGMVINAISVHFLLADNLTISSRHFEHVLKFTLLYFLMVMATRNKEDLRIVMLTMVIGMAYIGFEVTLNDRGTIIRGRLEGVGVPEGQSSNELASLFVTLLPISGALWLTRHTFSKVVAFFGAPLALNVVLLCNSRGGFLAAIGSGVAFLSTAPRGARKQAFKLVAMGLVALYFLLGDPRIIERFSTTFVGEEDRDNSATSRIEYWKAGFRMIADHPLGTGGHGFSKVHGMRYIAAVSGQSYDSRSVHNGYINEACEWGIQGFLLHIGFMLGGLILALRSMRRSIRANDPTGALYGCAILSCMLGFMISAIFGDFFDNEWGYWMVALAVVHARITDRGAGAIAGESSGVETPVLATAEVGN